MAEPLPVEHQIACGLRVHGAIRLQPGCRGTGIGNDCGRKQEAPSSYRALINLNYPQMAIWCKPRLGSHHLTTGIFQIFVIVAFIAAVLALSELASIETRKFGAPRLAAKLFYALIAGIIFLFYPDDAMVSSRAEQSVRSMFHLPDDIRVERVHGGDKNHVCYRKSVHHRTTVQFTPGQSARYVAATLDRRVWRPVVPPHYLPHKSRLQFADDAVAWQALPEPPHQSSR